jgi:proton-dependent oligopeptide transporter, POT family
LASDAAADRSFFGHPRGLGWLSFAELWERFSYYGMQSLLVLYLNNHLQQAGRIETVWGFAQLRGFLETLYGPLTTAGTASAVFGLYVGLIWLTPVLGGLAADRWTGRTPAITAGALLMTAGHFFMAFENAFLLALLCILIGVGLFKSNIAAQVGGLYAPGDQRLASAFQIYMFGIQVAVFAAPLIVGTLGEKVGWHWGFGAAGVGMLIGLVVYLAARPSLPADPPRRAAMQGAKPKFTPDEAKRGLVLIALLPVLALAQVGTLQISNAYLIWATTHYDLTVGSFAVPAPWLISLDTLCTGTMIALSVAFWARLRKTGREPTDFTKIGLGAVILALAPLFLVLISSRVEASGERASLFWALPFTLVYTLGSANFFAVALGLYSRNAPQRIGSTAIGIFYLHMFIGNLVIGKLGAMLETMPAANFWLMHCAIIAVMAGVLLLLRPWLNRLMPETPSTP